MLYQSLDKRLINAILSSIPKKKEHFWNAMARSFINFASHHNLDEKLESPEYLAIEKKINKIEDASKRNTIRFCSKCILYIKDTTGKVGTDLISQNVSKDHKIALSKAKEEFQLKGEHFIIGDIDTAELLSLKSSQEEMDAVQKNIEDLNEILSVQKNVDHEQNARMGRIEESNRNMQEKTTLLGSQVEQNSHKLSGLERKMDETNNNVGEICQKVQKTNDMLIDMQKILTALKDQVDKPSTLFTDSVTTRETSQGLSI